MAEVSTYNLNQLERKIDNLSQMSQEMAQMVGHVQASMSGINSSMNQVSGNLKVLTESIERMRNENRKEAMLQKATSELIRVRQEIEQKFGKYSIVRETMLGVLKATDNALVKNTTITNVSEELILATPDYWLSPCLVAVAAWIDNNRDLAERAIKVALDRDEAKTAITMALICRRNNRVDTCYEWLSLYFRKLDARNLSENDYAYIDAYINGVFGPDTKHMCDDYLMKWVNEIRSSNSGFEEMQEDEWKKYCEAFTNEQENLFPEFSESVVDAGKVTSYVQRIRSTGNIANYFSGITNAYVDQDLLKKDVDENLVKLICNYSDDEEPLRREEEYWLAVKAYDGDTEKAKEYMRMKDNAKKAQRLNLVEQMTKSLKSKEVSPSKRKTAISFLKGYIKKGFNNYITEKQDDFPQGIVMNVEGFQCSTTDGSNIRQLYSEYDKFMEECKLSDINRARNIKPKMYQIGAGVVAVLAIILMFAVHPIVGVLVLAGAAALFLMSFKEKKNIEERIAEIEKMYIKRNAIGKNRITRVVEQWEQARNIVNNYNNNPISDITA